MHRRVAARAQSGESILELGAGTLNHVPYESHYSRYDIVEPFEELWKDSASLACITNRYKSIFDLPADALYDRVFSIAVLEHLTDLPVVLARCRRMLAPGGIFQAGIPTEGGLLWGFGWRCVTGPAYRWRTGLDYSCLMRHEHVNRADEISALVRHFFGGVKVTRYPAPFYHLSFYSYLETPCRSRQLERERTK
ncbi:MAG: class I SAM-dependent methyltransferase [Acidobacteriales bacterium]|nr:class I SAM-dependent methyltransferase [Terriglobales bacterium]